MKKLLLGFLAMLGIAASVQAETPGRLFFTPEKREMLDALRRNHAQIATQDSFDSVRLDGIVRRSGGPQTIWINGRPYTAHAPVSRVDARSARIITGSKQGVELKVGESAKLGPDNKSDTP